MLIDFHTHSSASDGALSPDQLVARARAAGVALFAITDHDCVTGYRAVAARCAAGPAGFTLVPGIEYSCRWSGTTVHILGLGMDCDHPAMLEGVDVLCRARADRGRKISERLAGRGFPGALEGAMAEAGSSQLGRPHFAAWMVQQGHVGDPGEAFDRYLGQGKTGDVKAFWPELAQVIDWIVAAGGVAVIAHPLKYRFTRMKLRRLVVDFLAAGGRAIELVAGHRHPDQVDGLVRLAREFRLEVSVGSDFHRDSTFGPGIGVELPVLDGLRGVWERWSPGPGSLAKTAP